MCRSPRRDNERRRRCTRVSTVSDSRSCSAVRSHAPAHRPPGWFRACLDDDLVEWDYGDYEGLTRDQIQARDPGWTIFTGAVPNGETAEQVGARAQRVLDRCAAVEGRVLLFAHGHILRVLSAVALSFGPRAGAHFMLDPATISMIGTEHGARALSRWNDRGS
jgi:probable phosphoglycerate mutase